MTRRYPIELDALYRVIPVRRSRTLGRGKTVNISAGGVLLAVHEELKPKTLLEIIVDWPVKTQENLTLKLRLRGSVVRQESGASPMVAVKIARYELFNDSGEPRNGSPR